MAEFPALPLWTDAYLGDTAHLTNEEHGVYLRLLMFAWRSPSCSLPDDDRRLAIMTGLSDKKWQSIKPTIKAFWDIENGVWTQKRLTKEREFVRGKSAKSRDAALTRWSDNPLKNKETHNANAIPEHMPEACQDDAPTPIPTPIKKETGKPVSCDPDFLAMAFDEYNATASRVGWPSVQARTPARRAALKARLAEAGGIDGWRAALVKARASPHLCGQNDRGWTASFDFLTSQASFAKLMEGNYDPKPNDTNGQDRRRPRRPHDSMVAAFVGYAAELSGRQGSS
jgi:uncharacterized protein YdaU (DUF1376 family)